MSNWKINYNPIIIACDFATIEELDSFLNKFSHEQLFLKLGMEIIYSLGFEIIKYCKERGHRIFLDLKLCDIPQTVYKTLQILKKFEVDFITVHALGGIAMLRKAQDAIKDSKTKLLAVTVLTSLDTNDLKYIGINNEVNDEVTLLMKNVGESGINGVICSPYDANEAQKNSLVAITPGIRISQDANDQKRISTPEFALENGASYIVIGREITNSENPLLTYQEICKRINYEKSC